MASWGPLTYTVGSSALTDFPMAIFKDVNNPVTITFTATSNAISCLLVFYAWLDGLAAEVINPVVVKHQ